MKKIILLSLSILTIAFMIIPVAFAQDDGGGGNEGDDGGGANVPTEFKIPNPFTGGNDLFGFITSIINDIILPLGGMIAVLAFIYSGFLYVTAQGDPADLAKAHKALLYTAIGTAILLGAWAIANAIGATIDQLRA